jgi:acetyl-CoA synthetase
MEYARVRIKISAHRIGTIEIESALLQHPSVVEAAVVGRPDPFEVKLHAH